MGVKLIQILTTTIVGLAITHVQVIQIAHQSVQAEHVVFNATRVMRTVLIKLMNVKLTSILTQTIVVPAITYAVVVKHVRMEVVNEKIKDKFDLCLNQ